MSSASKRRKVCNEGMQIIKTAAPSPRFADTLVWYLHNDRMFWAVDTEKKLGHLIQRLRGYFGDVELDEESKKPEMRIADKVEALRRRVYSNLASYPPMPEFCRLFFFFSTNPIRINRDSRLYTV